ncbi:MAG: dihydroorotase [Deltaproteobacteria bacterium]|jgi:dihydroorotase|nr:dihydroorotase [Deltaproteobacteria bacterium]
MHTHMLFRGARIMGGPPELERGGDILVTDGAIAALGPSGSLKVPEPAAGRAAPAGCPEAPGQPESVTVDCTGLLAFPGFVDMHVHLRTPGHEHKEDLSSGLAAAAAGGFASVLAMPNTSPPVDGAAQVSDLLARAAKVRNGARLLQSACLTQGRKGESLCEYFEIREAGASAVTDDGGWVTDGAVMRRAIDYAAVCGLLPLTHPEDPTLSRGGSMHEGRVSTRLGLRGIPPQAEESAIYRDCALSLLTGNPVHVCHVSTAEGADLVRRFKAMGARVSCETAPHYLFLTHERVLGFDSHAKMNPPLRTERDREALRAALADGTVDAIATDHAPHSVLEKEVEFMDAACGITGLETAVPLALKLVRETGMPLARLASLMSLNPARLLGLPEPMKPGSPADLTLVDPDLEWTYLTEEGLSKSRNTPFEGWEFTGRAVMTVVGGEIRYRLVRP